MRVGLRRIALVACSLAAAPFVIALAGCGTATATANSANAAFTISPGAAAIDTNCTGCNATNARGLPVHRFTARLTNGSAATVTWSVSGGDAVAGPGQITAAGEYTPPSYLTADGAQVVVTARLAANPQIAASSRITVTPGFLQPLTPENVALGANGTVTVTGKLAVAGGSAGIQFALASTPAGTGGGQGTLGVTNCQRSSKAFTSCSVTYTAPANIAATDVTYLVAAAPGSAARTDAQILLNTAGVTSNPAGHQGQLPTLMPLGSSGGNNNDFDALGNTIADCCSGTLGSLIQDNGGRQYVLSNNHVLARSDHATVGDPIVQPGLDRQQLHADRRGPRHRSRGVAERMAAAQIAADQRRCGHRPGGLAHRRRERRHSRVGRAPGGWNTRTRGAGHFLHRRQRRKRGAANESGQERPDHGIDMRQHFRRRPGCLGRLLSRLRRDATLPDQAFHQPGGHERRSFQRCGRFGRAGGGRE